jgi:OHCU decarboxylase
MTLDALNDADERTFVDALGFIFEQSPWVAAAAWTRRPFSGIDALHAAMCDAVARAPLATKVALIAAHPDLVGRAARAGALSAASSREQAGAGLTELEPDDIALFTELNAAYRERFGFPFVICVRENTKAAIVAGLRRRAQNDRANEIATALDEIAKIARLRLADAVTS